ncbi:hypothetical protein LENED_010960 [Lentinula edodes]|uniref:Uncharacterized protein n=1 Tax=Lentinula edodes TaxID=5353 RepID=A0A1Q3ENR9_LENED|nr:hypothetical protein LENED_010960 [Lentinula edodes]
MNGTRFSDTTTKNLEEFEALGGSSLNKVQPSSTSNAQLNLPNAALFGVSYFHLFQSRNTYTRQATEEFAGRILHTFFDTGRFDPSSVLKLDSRVFNLHFTDVSHETAVYHASISNFVFSVYIRSGFHFSRGVSRPCNKCNEIRLSTACHPAPIQE